MKINTLDFDIQDLRNRILDLAMRGKLVPQDSNDEPANILLGKIKSKKIELIQKKKIRKSKKLPEITEEEKPFEIPDSWKWVRLGSIGEIFAGGDKPNDLSKIKDKQHQFPVYSNGVKNKGLYGFTGKAKVDNPAITLSARGTIGHVEYRNTPYFPIIRLISFVPYNKECLKCLYYFLQSKKFIEEGNGSSIPQLTVPKLKPKVIPLPPLAEQKRIANKVSQLFDQIDKIESASQQYAELQSSLKAKILDVAIHGNLVEQNSTDEPAGVLLDKIKSEKDELIKEKKIKKSKQLAPIDDGEKPFDIPDNWEWVRLGDVSNFIGTGMVVPTSQQFDTPTNEMLAYFKMNNIGNWNGKFGVGKWTYILKNDKVRNYILKPGQLLFNTRNSRELVGKTTIVPNHINKKSIVANNNILRIESFGNIELKYINYYLISPFSRNTFLRLTTATTSVAAIYQKQLKKFLVPLPPLEEQKRIVAKLEKIFAAL